MLRVTGGVLRGRSILLSKDSKIRPTTDKVRSAVFSILGDAINGAKVLDMFCGSGSYGIESLSRGAEYVLFVDIDLKNIKTNFTLLEDFNYDVLKSDCCKKYIPDTGNVYDLVFIDPPYEKTNIKNILFFLVNNNFLVKNSVVVYEESSRYVVDFNNEFFTLIDERKYGDSKIMFLEVL